MDRLQTLRTFIAVAEQASFAAAARQLRATPTSVSRAVAALETSLGVALLVRTTRSVRLTDEGAAFLARSRAGLAEIDGAAAEARGVSSLPQGLLTVTAPVMFGRLHIVRIVVELLDRHPGLRVRLLLLDRVVRLVEEGIDVAVRIADLPDSALVGRRIASVGRILVASPGYLARAGHPRTPDELKRHRLILIENEALAAAPVATSIGAARLVVNGVEAAIAAAVAGMGVLEALSYQVADRIADGTLEFVLPDAAIPLLPVSLLFQGARAGSPNIRAFTDLARERLGGASL